MRLSHFLPLLAIPTLIASASAQRALAGAVVDVSQVLRAADADGDGSITRTEFAEMQKRLFLLLDRDHDGYLSTADTEGHPAAESAGANGVTRALSALDQDGDGRISRNEFIDGPGLLFDVADANRDGVLDPKEIETIRARAVAGRAS